MMEYSAPHIRLVALPITSGRISLVVAIEMEPSSALVEVSQHIMAVMLPNIGATTMATLF